MGVRLRDRWVLEGFEEVGELSVDALSKGARGVRRARRAASSRWRERCGMSGEVWGVGYWRVRRPVPVSCPQTLVIAQLEMVMVTPSGEVKPVPVMVAPVRLSV